MMKTEMVLFAFAVLIAYLAVLLFTDFPVI